MRRKYTDFLIQWKKHQKTRNLTRFRAEMNIDTEMYLLSLLCDIPIIYILGCTTFPCTTLP